MHWTRADVRLGDELVLSAMVQERGGTLRSGGRGVKREDRHVRH